MSYPFFNSVLEQLNRKLRFDTAVAYAGNSFVKESSQMIQDSNPFIAEPTEQDAKETYMNQLSNMIMAGQISIENNK